MFGISDPGIWLAYLLALVVFIPMGYSEPDGIKQADEGSTNPQQPEK